MHALSSSVAEDVVVLDVDVVVPVVDIVVAAAVLVVAVEVPVVVVIAGRQVRPNKLPPCDSTSGKASQSA